jgi:hypothetical protein
MDFFERTAQDSACFIDIAKEKYKTAILGDHRQEKKRNEKTRLAWLDWDITTGYRSKKLAGRSDWVINTARHYTQRRHRRQKNNRSLHPQTRMYRTEEEIRY